MGVPSLYPIYIHSFLHQLLVRPRSFKFLLAEGHVFMERFQITDLRAVLSEFEVINSRVSKSTL